ncbi:MAG TPA: tRNA 2-thiouridine(34) synthase MnmA [Actinomycetota bacterium]|nr:tRNA 2-thiouridine(34) synthase MnmA [Actinomycetota bacterium]
MSAPRRRKAVVAMSGGVDSSVAAALLVDEGFDVTGVMLKLWRGEDVATGSGCCSVGAADDARRVADVLGIPFYVFDFAQRFEDTVVADFRAEYASGRTPNPCVRCNAWIKFDALLERARVLGADVLATGHYARVRHAGGRYRLLRGVDARKDQSYVLWMLGQRELERCRFPVGEMDKTTTRRIAADLGLRTAAKPDSQEICFVRDGDVGAYVERHVAHAARSGAIVDRYGRRVGEHRGIGRYTVGQRRGLGVSLGAPVFVTGIDARTNTVVVGARADLDVASVRVREARFVDRPPAPGERVLLQHRAHGDAAPGAVARVADDAFDVAFDAPASALAPGQSAVLYAAERPDEVVGGGIVASTVPVAVA